MPTSLLVDYGCVISLPQPAAAVRALETAVPDVAPVDFWHGYWDLRLDYDRGMPDLDYWSGVLGRPATEAESTRLTELDIAGWSTVDERVTALLDRAVDAGVPLGLLSNAPVTMARALEAAPWAARFTSLTFSGDLRVAKPDAEAYLAAARALGAHPSEVVFVDDRPENIAGAHAVGMTALHHTSADALERDLGRHLPLR
ncbi:HAD-IA family hydrolase [Motilibacter peucedani]|uniref:HAD-IA family hydrolase n=1 Tax=Motilibacter peucedani TaxID=598650 RepID=UPI001E36B6D0|nr:HAD-IA family hydrolase [Motilibacter peucedani]